MVKKIVTWLLNKAGILGRLDSMEVMVDKVIEGQFAEIRERLDELEKARPDVANAPSAAELLNEWLNGGHD